MVLKGGPPREAAMEVDRYVDVAEFVPVDERTVEIGEEDLLAKRQKVVQGRGDASLLTRC